MTTFFHFLRDLVLKKSETKFSNSEKNTEEGMGKFPHSSLKAHFIFPTHGLAVVVKNNFPTREIFIHQAC